MHVSELFLSFPDPDKDMGLGCERFEIFIRDRLDCTKTRLVPWQDRFDALFAPSLHSFLASKMLLDAEKKDFIMKNECVSRILRKVPGAEIKQVVIGTDEFKYCELKRKDLKI